MITYGLRRPRSRAADITILANIRTLVRRCHCRIMVLFVTQLYDYIAVIVKVAGRIFGNRHWPMSRRATGYVILMRHVRSHYVIDVGLP